MRIHLAYGGTKQLRVIGEAGHRFALVSALQFKRSGPIDDFSVAKDLGVRLLVDSGVYTFMFGPGKHEPRTYEGLREYALRYLDRLDAQGYEGDLVEVDAQRLIGAEATNRLREEFAHLGDRVMYVWHEPEGLDGLNDLARGRSFVALGIPELRHIAETKGSRLRGGKLSIAKAMTNDLLRRIHQATDGSPPRIHLLGSTTGETVETAMAWSCDATTWLNATRFGLGHVWDGRRIFMCRRTDCETFQAYRSTILARYPERTAEIRTWPVAGANPDYYLDLFITVKAIVSYQCWLDTRFQNVPMRGAELPGGPIP